MIHPKIVFALGIFISLSACATAEECKPTTYWFDQAVEDAIVPPSWHRAAIRIAVTAEPFDEKIFLVAEAKGFALYRARVSGGLSKSLDVLSKRCKVPPLPEEAAEAINVEWSSQKIDKAVFSEWVAELYKLLEARTVGVSKLAQNAIATNASDLTFHSRRYVVVVETNEIAIEYASMEKDAPDPIIEWMKKLRRTAGIQDKP